MKNVSEKTDLFETIAMTIKPVKFDTEKTTAEKNFKTIHNMLNELKKSIADNYTADSKNFTGFNEFFVKNCNIDNYLQFFSLVEIARYLQYLPAGISDNVIDIFEKSLIDLKKLYADIESMRFYTAKSITAHKKILETVIDNYNAIYYIFVQYVLNGLTDNKQAFLNQYQNKNKFILQSLVYVLQYADITSTTNLI